MSNFRKLAPQWLQNLSENRTQMVFECQCYENLFGLVKNYNLEPGRGGGTSTSFVRGGVWPQGWKIDPSAD